MPSVTAGLLGCACSITMPAADVDKRIEQRTQMAHPGNVTQADVANSAGVSRSLVSLALSGSPKVAAETREHILSVAASLGYRANTAASALARRRSTTIGLVLPNLRNAFFEQVSRSLDDAAAQRGLTTFVTVGAEDQERLRRAIDSLLGVRVLGIILVSPWLTDGQLVALGEETRVNLHVSCT